MKTKTTHAPSGEGRPDLSKVSKTVRFYIEKLESDLASKSHKLHAMTVSGESEVGLLDYDAPNHFLPLPPGSTIVFRLDPDAERGREVHAKVVKHHSLAKVRRLDIRGQDRYGSGALAVRPAASNSAEVFLDPADQNVQ